MKGSLSKANADQFSMVLNSSSKDLLGIIKTIVYNYLKFKNFFQDKTENEKLTEWRVPTLVFLWLHMTV